MSSVRIAGIIAVLAFSLQIDLVAQNSSAPEGRQTSTQIPLLHIKLTDNSKVSLPYPDTLPTLVKQCDNDGNVYSSIFGSNGLDIAGFTEDGIRVFSASAITDVPEASINRFFITDSGVEVLVTGIENVKKKIVTDTIAGTDQKVQRVKKEGDTVYYIARFAKDGTYKSAVELDIPRLVPYQIGAFPSGNYILAGIKDDTEPLLFLVNSSGQAVKLLELPGDIAEGSKALQTFFSSDRGSDPTPVSVAAMFASILSYRDKVLFVRTGMNPIVYEIRDGGEIRAIKLHLPSGYSIGNILQSDNKWMVELQKGPLFRAADAESEGERETERNFVEIDPENGKVLRQYRLRGSRRAVDVPAVFLPCWRGGEFRGVHQAQGRVTLVRGDVETAP